MPLEAPGPQRLKRSWKRSSRTIFQRFICAASDAARSRHKRRARRTEPPEQDEPPPGNDFLWGVATSAYQTEGGYNGVGQPQTNWAAAEQASHVGPSGNAAEVWT